jgi:hypothetical protein
MRAKKYPVTELFLCIQYVAKSIGAFKKKSPYNQPKPYIFSKKNCEVISG